MSVSEGGFVIILSLPLLNRWMDTIALMLMMQCRDARKNILLSSSSSRLSRDWSMR